MWEETHLGENQDHFLYGEVLIRNYEHLLFITLIFPLLGLS
jgi:hypothetical protein